MTPPSAAATFATRLVAEFASLGVKHAVLAPGSRSQALALALAAAEQRGEITVHVRIDERVAGFTALGIGLETGVPALVVTTSGTAVANLLPAVVEASHSGVPLIVLSADRPAVLRGTGSNQTTWQPGIFGRFVRAEVDVPAPGAGAGGGDAGGVDGSGGTSAGGAADAAVLPDARALAVGALERATGVDAGPVHLNLQFVAPLSGALLPDGTATQAETSAYFEARAATSVRRVHLAQGPRTVVVAGADAGEAAAELAARAGWPLLAEVSSGSRFGPDLVVAYRELLDAPEFGPRVERAVVFGHPTLSRQIPKLLARDDVEVIVRRGPGEPVVPAADATIVDEVTADAAERDDRAARAWRGQWVFASRELLEGLTSDDEVAAPLVSEGGSDDLAARRDFAKGELAALRAPVTRRSLALAVWRASWPHDRLVLGASRLIRELDAVAPGKKIPVRSNRGLAGIDGTISTALGVALASQTSGARVGTTRVLLGDITMLHDVGALLLGGGETRPRIQLVVGNDGGGTIFDSLEVAASADPSAFDRVLFTPQNVDLASLAAAYGWQHRVVEHRGDLDSVLASPLPGTSIVEVPLPR